MRGLVLQGGQPVGGQVQGSSRDQGVGLTGSFSGGHSQKGVGQGLPGRWAGVFRRRESNRRPDTLPIDERRSILPLGAEGAGVVVGVKDAVSLAVIGAVKVPFQVVVFRRANHEPAFFNTQIRP